jgi:hypothetical protein
MPGKIEEWKRYLYLSSYLERSRLRVLTFTVALFRNSNRPALSTVLQHSFGRTIPTFSMTQKRNHDAMSDQDSDEDPNALIASKASKTMIER